MSYRDRADPIMSLFGCRDRVKGDSNWLLVIIGWIRRSGNSGAMTEMGKPGDQLMCWGGADGGDGQGVGQTEEMAKGDRVSILTDV